ncbi:hypothetical protein [Spongiibacter marinus]|uniref:hypothetical protein n=1 Tax=Spongiibacter marinus TaxID=354246 RepID=UPI0035BE822E
MKLRIEARYRLCTQKIARAVGISASVVRQVLRSLFSSYIFSSLYFPTLGYVMLLVYMSEYDFFSYELVSTSFFAVTIFMQAAIAGLMITAFGLFSSFVCWAASRRGIGIGVREYWPIIVVNAFMFLLFVVGLLAARDKVFPLSVLAICAGISAFYIVLLTGTLKAKVYSIVLLFVLSIGGAFFYPSVSSGIFSNGLRVFGIGGKTPVTIYDEASPSGFMASLVLVTPSTVYFLVDDKPGFVPVSKLLRVERQK